jgi:CubicO group peptidase (beta-lactamase class C family)
MKKTLLYFLIFVFSITAYAQWDSSKAEQIDKLFLEWNTPNFPGGTITIVQNGIPLFSRAYGLASLEYLVPNTTGTQYNIASVSKQFTAMGIVLLHLQGKLSVDDDVRKHIPELPDFGPPITLRHMLHHTSGMRSLHTMLSLAGWRSGDARTNQDLYRFMLNQKDLNFVPGDEYMYCNTGYILMAEIIERISDEKFATWMKKQVFEPLGMYSTYVEDKYNRIVPNNATSYSGTKEGGFEREVEFWGYTGSGNIHSTTHDLLKWYRNYYQPTKGWEQAFSKMLTVDSLNNGDPNNYAFGVRVDLYKGEKRISHGGSIGGYRAFACTYPDRQLDIVALTNFSSSAAEGKVNAITNIILGKSEEAPARFELEARQIDLAEFDALAGTYTMKESPDRLMELSREKDAFFLRLTGQDRVRVFAADKKTFFNNSLQLKLVFSESGKQSYTLTQNGRSFSGSKTVKYVPSLNELEEIAGSYWSPELHTLYSFKVYMGSLYGYHSRHGDFQIECLRKDEYVSRASFISKITVIRDEGGRVTGLFMTNSRVRNLRFEKSR